MRTVFLSIHIASGALALLLGPLLLLAHRRSRETWERLLTAYFWTVLVVCVTAAIVSALAWSRLWWLIPVAAVSYGLVLVGYLAAKRGWPSWIRAHGLGGSYIALVTAVLVVSLRDSTTAAQVLSWILPAAIGTPLIVRTHTGPRAATV